MQRYMPCRTVVVNPSLALSNLNGLAAWRKMVQNFPIPLSVFRFFFFGDIFPSLWHRGSSLHGFAERGHGALQKRSLISYFFVAVLAPLLFPIVWCLSNFLSLHARLWELDSQQHCTGARAKEQEQRREQNAFLGRSSALGVLGYWLGMTDLSLSSNLKVGLVTGSPPARLFNAILFQHCCHLSQVWILWSLRGCEENPGTPVLLSRWSTVHSDFTFCLPTHSETKTNIRTQNVPCQRSDPVGKS